MIRLTAIVILASCVFTCPDKDLYCTACRGSVCAQCIASYVDSKGKCVPPSKKVDRCISYVKDGVCQICENGYHVDRNGRCIAISIKNCNELASIDKCAICKRGILVKNGRCDDSQSKCTIKNCDYCTAKNGIEFCARCQSGYAILFKDGKTYCQGEVGKTNNCLYLSASNPNTCAVCDFNYYFRSGNCQKSTKYSINVNKDYIISVMALFLFGWLLK